MREPVADCSKLDKAEMDCLQRNFPVLCKPCAAWVRYEKRRFRRSMKAKRMRRRSIERQTILKLKGRA